MTGKISLTASMRSNLLSLQNISRQVDSTQNKLATGNKVNSAIDNPSSYYTARSLNNRAGDLDALLDSMGQAVQTIKTATTALETGAAFLEQAAAIADQALEGSTSVKDNSDNDNKTNGVQLVTKDLSEYIAEGYTVITSDMTANEINALMVEGAKLVLADDIVLDGPIGSQDDNVTINGNGNKITYDSTYIDSQFFILFMGHGNKLSNIELDLTAHPNGTMAVCAEYGASIDVSSIKITVHGNNAAGICVFDGSSIDASSIEITGYGDAFYGIGANDSSIDVSSIKMTIYGDNSYGVAAIDGGKVTLDSDDGIQVIGANSQKVFGDVTYVGKADDTADDDTPGAGQTEVDTLSQERFNSVLSQYNMLINDASYKGVNLLKSQTLNVRFNENGSSDLNVAGKDMTSGALGLNTADWNNMNDIAQSLKEIANALNTIRAFTSELGNNYSIITSRQEFTDSLINILTEGADKLTLADMNEESANMLALQTRQQLAVNALSLASQSAQSILKLF